MQDYQQAFLKLAHARKVLRFGEFTLKSGRISPYFFNAGLFNSGAALFQLGRFYAQAVHEADIQFDVLFGPAYKGIPLAACTAAALYDVYRHDTAYCFNRKEAKDHGEAGLLVGAPLQGRVLIIDDVITAGTAVRESIQIIQQAGAVPAGIVVALDRQERGQGSLSAIQEVEREYAVPVISIVTLEDIISYLSGQAGMLESLEAVRAYRERYGI